MSIEFRECTVQDIDTLSALGRETYHDTFAAMNTLKNMRTYLDTAFNRETLLKELLAEHSQFLFLFCDDELAGYLKLNEEDAQTDMYEHEALEIERIYLRSVFQGRGLGKVLIEKAMESARSKNKSYVWLGVWKRNRNAVAFYRRMGFTVFGSHDFRMGEELQSDYLMRRDIG